MPVTCWLVCGERLAVVRERFLVTYLLVCEVGMSHCLNFNLLTAGIGRLASLLNEAKGVAEMCMCVRIYCLGVV